MSSKAAAASSQQRHTKPTPVHKAKRKAKALPVPKLQRPPTPDTSGSPEHQQNHYDEAADDSSDASDSVAVAPSRTPRTRRPSVKPKLDKGKQRDVSQEQVMNKDEFVAPKSRLPRKRVSPPKRDVFEAEPQASGSQPRRSPNVLTTSKIPKQSSQTRASSSRIPVKATAKKTAPPSSAVRARSRSRARTSSVIPAGEVWSAIKPVPLKTVFRSSPPRVIKISDSASSASGSDDEFLLRASRSSDISTSLQKSKKRRKPNAGEFEWDEKSRSCIVKRERSRSRSLAAYPTLGTGSKAKNEPAHSDEDDSGVNDPSQMDMEDASMSHNNSHILDGLHDGPDTDHPQDPHDHYMDEGPFDQQLPVEEVTHEDSGEAAVPVYDFTNAGDASSSMAGSDSESEDDAFERSVQQIPVQEADGHISMLVDMNEKGQVALPANEKEERPFIKEEGDDVAGQDSFLDSFQEANPEEHEAIHSAQGGHAIPYPESAGLAREGGSSAKMHALPQQSEGTKKASARESKMERRSTSPLPPSSPPPLPASRESTASNEAVGQLLAEEELQEDDHIDQPAQVALHAGLSTAIQSTPRASMPMKRLQVTGIADIASQATSLDQCLSLSPSGCPALVVASSSSPQPFDTIAGIPATSHRTRALTPTLRVSDSRTVSPTAGGSDVYFAPPADKQREQTRHLSPWPKAGKLPTTRSQHCESPFAKLEGLLSPKAGARRTASRSPSPLSQASQPSQGALLEESVSHLAGSYRSPREPSLSTSPQPGPTVPIQRQLPQSPAPNPSVNLFSTPARLRSARSVSPLITPNQAHSAQPQASLLQMLRTAAVTSASKQKEPNILQPARSPSIADEKEGYHATQDVVTSLLERIDRHRRSISVEVREATAHPDSSRTPATMANPAQSIQAGPSPRGTSMPAAASSVSGLRDVSPSLAAHSVAIPATPDRMAPRQDVGLSTPAAQAFERTTSVLRTLQSPARIDSSSVAIAQSKQGAGYPASDVAQKSTPSAPLLGRSPAIQRALAPLDSPQLSPNVTVRRGRSASYSSASTMSVRSKPNTPREQIVRGRKLSFTELGSFDSSPLSVAASIGCHSFEALDGNSDDEDGPAGPVRPSPSKELAQQQKQASARFDSTLSSSSSEESDEEDCESDEDTGSNLVQTFQQVSQVSETVSSTPAKKMTDLALTSSNSSPVSQVPATSTPGRTKALHSPIASSHSSPAHSEALPSTLRNQGDDLHEDSMFVEAGSFDGSEDAELPSLMVEGCSSEADLLSKADQSCEGDSSNMSVVLDEARPRSRLVPPPLTKHSRPVPGRRRSRPASNFGNLDGSDAECAQEEPASNQVCSPAPQRARSGSAFSRAESVISNSSTVVQVSSNDPKAAARAAAILKIHHKYIQEGSWPARSPDFAEQSGNSPEGERVLDELLKEAELEVSMYTEDFDTTSQLDISVESEEAKPNQSLLPGRSLKHGSHRLAVWTRHDWRNLEQCFIDERRRTKLAKIEFDANEVVRIFLENEQLRLENCVGEWDTGKILLRVEALQARKEQKQEQEASQRARSTSFVSSVWSRAPSDFLSREDSRLGAGNQSTSTEEDSFLQIPGGLTATGRRYARSAEPQGKIYEKRDGYSHLSSRHPSTSMRDGIHRRAASLTDVEAMPQLRKAQPLSSRVSKLYPPLDDLAADMRPKKAMPIKGRSVLAAVNMFERIEEEQSLEVVKSRVPKRKDISDTVSESGSSKRVRI